MPFHPDDVQELSKSHYSKNDHPNVSYDRYDTCQTFIVVCFELISNCYFCCQLISLSELVNILKEMKMAHMCYDCVGLDSKCGFLKP